MVTDFVAAPKRRMSIDVAQSRRAMAVIRPFVSQFEGWNLRAARASATALSHVASPAEQAEQARNLASLYVEVDQAFEEFERTVVDEPRHGRIDDLRAAFVRLRSVLEHWRGAN